MLLKDNLQAVEDKLLRRRRSKGKETEKADLDPVTAQLEKLRAKAEATRVNEEAMRLFRWRLKAQPKRHGPERGKVKDPDKPARRSTRRARWRICKRACSGRMSSVRLTLTSWPPSRAWRASRANRLRHSARRWKTTKAAEPTLLRSLIGFQKDDKGVSPADTAAEKAVSTLAAAIGAQVTGKDFVGKMIGYGETIWGYTEEGMINKAKASTAFAVGHRCDGFGGYRGALQ